MCVYMVAFIATKAEMSYLWDYMAPKAWNTHYLALYRIKFPILGVKYSNPVIPVLRSLLVFAGVTGMQLIATLALRASLDGHLPHFLGPDCTEFHDSEAPSFLPQHPVHSFA